MECFISDRIAHCWDILIEGSLMSGIYKEDNWSLGEAQINGLPLIVRTRSRLPAIPDREIYENLIIISWPYTANESGMPQPEENQRTIQFEDALEKALAPKGVGVQAACLTGNGSKEWRYYTYDTDEFVARLNQGLADHPPYPIELQMFKDPEWDALGELLAPSH